MEAIIRSVLIAQLIVWLGLSSNARAVNPPPDGGYPGGNTAEGQNALLSLTSGRFNTAVGFSSLKSNTIGNVNTAIGVNALTLNTTGINNTANGVNALYFNTMGDENTANGVYALFSNTIGGGNTASGGYALWGNTTGSSNTAIGEVALILNTTGSSNTAVGAGALHLGGDSNTALGVNAGYDINGSNNIDIGANVLGFPGESNTIRIGNTDITDTFISGISGTTVASGAAVLVDSSGHLGTVTSSTRFKEEIRPMNKTSEAIFCLEPVTFRYKKEIDPAGTSQFGLIAEEVAKVNPSLVLADKEGKPYTVRYDAVNAMLLNEFLKEHRKAEEQEATIMQLRSEVTKQDQAIARQRQDFETTISELRKKMETVVTHAKEQDARIQQVSPRTQSSKPAPQIASSD
jgi:hypothetical protein